MDKLKQWVALTVVAVLAIVAAGWFLLVSPKRAEAVDLRAQVDSQVSANLALRGQIAMLKSQAKSLPQKQAKLAAVAAKIPDNPALPSLIRALTVAAEDAGVELISLAPTAPVAVAAPVRAAAPGTPAAGAPAAGAPAPRKPVAGAPAAGAPAAGAAAAAAAGVLKSITISIRVVGGYFQIEQFFDRVESLSRAMKATSLSLTPGPNPLKPEVPGAATNALDSTLSGSINATVFMATGRTTTAVTGK